MKKELAEAHRFSSQNRNELTKDHVCGCFHCLKIFHPREIDEWVDNGETAICPYCGIDSIIGESSGVPINVGFLRELQKVWF
ncbi:hypothetical protein SAMN05192533_110136 [Mesobacillus persicus]|uniref:Cytoplasmic protein n=1 Tax=Mesobacillus persicus TaxID=930146 RepID=A0A1H8EWY8_9BACI|nr:cytoplasmic protein [Mesobacillus persicus]SEN24003.1 hypothetical protein SAMN05192533_110136 [Mesobacillus persicus]